MTFIRNDDYDVRECSRAGLDLGRGRLPESSSHKSRFVGARCGSMGLRKFINSLSQHNCLKRVTHSVDWKFEIGDITRNNRVPLLFENIKDYPGFRVLTNGLSCSASMALALGLDPRAKWEDIVDETRRKAVVPKNPVLTESGPVLENAVEGSEIDLLKFPVPQWNRHDAGRYIGTWHVNVTRDPETGSRNLGVYRMQVLGPRHATVSTSANSDLGCQVARAEKMGTPLEMAVVIGAAELVVMAAAAGYPRGMDEYELAGGLDGAGMALISCKTVNLEVPADSELVIEGVLKPGVRVQDGPYFDYAGKPTTNPNAFVFEASRLAFRNELIFRGAAIGHPGAEDQQLFSLLSELGLFDFHNSRPRHVIEKQLIKRRLFRAFQSVGRIGVPDFIRQILARTKPAD